MDPIIAVVAIFFPVRTDPIMRGFIPPQANMPHPIPFQMLYRLLEKGGGIGFSMTGNGINFRGEGEGKLGCAEKMGLR